MHTQTIVPYSLPTLVEQTLHRYKLHNKTQLTQRLESYRTRMRKFSKTTESYALFGIIHVGVSTESEAISR